LNRTLTVKFGGVRTHIAGLDDPLRETLVRRFGRFLEERPFAGIADFVISVRPAPVARFVDRSGDGEMPRLESEIRGDRVLLRSHSFAGSFSLGGREAEVLLCEGSREPVHSSFERFLRAALAWRFLAKGSLLLNSFAIVEQAPERRARLLYSPDGIPAGTVSSIAAGDPVLGNGQIVIEKLGGRLHAHPLPLPGEPHSATGNELRPYEILPVSEIHLWSPDIPDSGGTEREFTASLLACAPFVSTTPRGASKAIDAIRVLTRGVPMTRVGAPGPFPPPDGILHTLAPEVIQ
jgi:hypothetical protein